MDEKKVTLRVCYNGGTDDQGKTIVKKQSYSNIITTASKANIKAAANAIGGLSANTMMYAETVTTERIK